jgi:hypothetical protein
MLQQLILQVVSSKFEDAFLGVVLLQQLLYEDLALEDSISHLFELK